MLELSGLSFEYAGHEGEGVTQIDLRVPPGECVVLTGSSGCGKSTLLRCVNGLAGRFYPGNREGRVLLQGMEVADLEHYRLASLVGTVFQDPRSQFFSVDSLSELCFVCENLGLDRALIRARAEEAAFVTGVTPLLGRSVLDLSGGERQLLALASVRAALPLLYCLDEPSANLDPEATRRLARVLIDLKREGAALLLAEHKLWYLREIIDRLIVIEGGRIVEELSGEEARSLPGCELDRRGLRRLEPGMLVHELPSRAGALLRSAPPVVRAVALARRKKGHAILAGASLALWAGEVTALVGPNGAGKTTLARVLCGLERIDHGRVYLGGRRARRKELVRSAYYLAQDCDYQLFSESVEKEILLGNRTHSEVQARAERFLCRLGLAKFRLRHPASLSRGQKQRLCAACALMKRPLVLALDEPTSGLDAATALGLGDLFREAAREGTAVLAITHDFEFALRCADRVVVLHSGAVAEDYRLDSAGLRRLRRLFFPEARGVDQVVVAPSGRGRRECAQAG